MKFRTLSKNPKTEFLSRLLSGTEQVMQIPANEGFLTLVAGEYLRWYCMQAPQEYDVSFKTWYFE